MEAWMLGALVFVVVLVVGAALLSRKERHRRGLQQRTASLPPKSTAQDGLVAQRMLLVEQPADLTTGATLCAVLAVVFNVLMLIVVISTINVGIATGIYAVRAMVFGFIWLAGNQVLIAIVLSGRRRKFVLRRIRPTDPPEPKPPPAF